MLNGIALALRLGAMGALGMGIAGLVAGEEALGVRLLLAWFFLAFASRLVPTPARRKRWAEARARHRSEAGELGRSPELAHSVLVMQRAAPDAKGPLAHALFRLQLRFIAWMTGDRTLQAVLLGEEEAVRALQVAAESDRMADREMALTSMAELERSEATDALLSGLQDPEWSVRLTAALGLSSRPPGSAAEALRAACGDPHPLVWLGAASSLKAMGEEPPNDRLLEVMEHRTYLDEDDLKRAMMCLIRLEDDRSVPWLIEVLEAKSPIPKFGALAALQPFRTPETVEAACRALEVPQLKSSALSLIAHYGDERALPAAREMLSSRNEHERLTALAALDEFRPVRPPEEVRRLARDPSVFVRVMALRVLHRAGESQEAALRRLLHHRRASVRKLAQEALGRP